MNRRGDFPTILLFFVTIVLALSAWFSFASFNDVFATDSEGRSSVLSDVAFYQNYIVKESEIIARQTLIDLGVIVPTDFVGPTLPPASDEDLKERFQELIEERKVVILGIENYYGKIEREEFSFERAEDRFVFSMDDVFVYSEKGANRIRRTFSFEIVFDTQGKIVERKIYK